MFNFFYYYYYYLPYWCCRSFTSAMWQHAIDVTAAVAFFKLIDSHWDMWYFSNRSNEYNEKLLCTQHKTKAKQLGGKNKKIICLWREIHFCFGFCFCLNVNRLSILMVRYRFELICSYCNRHGIFALCNRNRYSTVVESTMLGMISKSFQIISKNKKKIMDFFVCFVLV